MMNSAAHSLWYSSPAVHWNEALPIGNGRVGAMIFGGAGEEMLSLNEDTLWTGYPMYHEKPGAPQMLEKAREHIAKGELLKANSLLSEQFTNTTSEMYLPLGDLILRFGHEEVQNYRRCLHLATGVHTVSYDCGGVTYRRTACVSSPDQVLALHLSASGKGKLSFALSYTSKLRTEITAEGTQITVEGLCPTKRLPYGVNQGKAEQVYEDDDAKKGVRFACIARILLSGGSLCAADGTLTAQNADEATILFAVRTSYNGWDKSPYLEGRSYREPCRADIDKAAARGFYAILASHAADHGALYSRCVLDLGGGEEGMLPTNERLAAHQAGVEDPALYALLFHYGRYLTIASSRPGTQATNLQGIWNHHLIAPWNCNYTVNINTQMNYWPTLMTALPECYGPLIDLIGEIAVSGSRTARDYYGARGFCCHHNTDLWRITTPMGNGEPLSAVWGFWPLGSGWFIRHIWEYYEYTQDRKWLEETGYPLIRDCALFYSDVLVEDSSGCLSLSPSTSPENHFRLEDDNICSVAETSTMTTAIIRDVFTIFLKSSALLGQSSALVTAVSAQLPRLRPYALRPDGSLMEWSEDYPEVEQRHRHISHLYGMHPGREITPEDTPELAAAVRKTLENRGDDGTGWSLGWKINQYARLHDGDHALRLIDMQLRLVPVDAKYPQAGGSYPNLFDAHPPFQIDGNFGACSGIAEMLLQGDADHPLILPALPTAWKSGSVFGLRMRGGKTADIVWEDGRAVKVDIH